MATRTRERSSLWSRLSRRKRWFWFCEDEPPPLCHLQWHLVEPAQSRLRVRSPMVDVVFDLPLSDGTVQAEGQSSRSRTRIGLGLDTRH
ncbi:hypothetical protein INR49_020453 [Caranx melampygus]|nr:hypothetical protein INR49_020453 [Caranx melampygus]